MSNRKVLVLDGYNLIYRARYSSKNISEYSTIFNFFRSLRLLVEKFNPDMCYFVLEGKPVKRLEKDDSYKAQRVYHNRDNFQMQRKEIIRLVKDYLPVTTVRHPFYECDDIANYIANYKHKQDDATIISSDTDFIQSINEKTKVYNPVKKEYLQKFEYDYVQWKSLVGDKSDNIIGFKGIGNKKAILLLENNEKLSGFLSVEGNMKRFKDNIFMIKFHDIEEDVNNIEYFNTILESKKTNWEKLKSEFSKMSFKTIIEKEKTWNKFIKTFDNLIIGDTNV
jgi:5'-3' exonuclease